ncbi:MAG: hypothetical protein M4579_002357 [Chaenotheca gracillima]|nr:MAG: hypothetical protein M4579_002357 [Chaenotheca gracillima]
MAFFWIQQWGILPRIVEEGVMGDAPPPGASRPPSVPTARKPMSSSQTGAASDDPSTMSRRPSGTTPGSTGHQSQSTSPARQPSHGQYQQQHSPNFPQSMRPDHGGQFHPAAGSHDRNAPFNMAAMGASLPFATGQQQFAAFQNQAGPQLYQLQPNPQYANQAAMQYQQNQLLQAQYGQSYHPYYPQQSHQGAHPPQLQQGYQQQFANPYATQALSQGQAPYPGPQWQSQQHQNINPLYYPRAAYGPMQQPPTARGYGNYPIPPQRRLSLPLSQRPVQLQEGSEGNDPTRAVGGGDVPYGYGSNVPFVRPGSVPGEVGRTLAPHTASNPSMPRGPPRKPRQSGHALWVGNLPPGTRVVDLKDHFSKDATADIESVFLISKSNCAFVNYRTETTCAAAMNRFHDSRFQGVRLVCRLRRNSVNPPAASPGAATTPSPGALSEKDVEEPDATESKQETPQERPAYLAKDKYFVVKSLTMEDLELSVRNGVWATQSHNEAALNKAYETAENVYLVFSANKSGEYFGYARMASAINEESSAAIEWAPSKTKSSPEQPAKPQFQQQLSPEIDLPKAIPTPATEFAPKGRIIDDSARGTIFWEAETDETLAEGGESPNPDTSAAEDSNNEEETRRKESGGASTEGPGGSSWGTGNPFKINWISTSRLPFYRTRGLRNPWNANREVKIARDGTELEPTVGKRLVQMFHRPPQGPQGLQGPGGMGVGVGMPGVIPGMPGFGLHPPQGPGHGPY